MSIADWSKPLGGFTVSPMSRAGGRDVAVAMRDCGISTTSQTRPVCKHCFSALRSIKRCQWKHKLDYYGVVFAHLATGCGIKAKDPEGLDSDRWIPHSRCCENPARAKALAGFSRHLSAGFTNLNPAPRDLSIYYLTSAFYPKSSPTTVHDALCWLAASKHYLLPDF